MKRFLAIAFAVLIFSNVGHAYIPPYWMIAARTVDNNGNGFYQLDVDVVFSHEAEPKIVSERWFVLDENNMRLEVRSKKGFRQDFAVTYIYDRNQRTHLDKSGQRRNSAPGKEFFEKLFHARDASAFKNELIKLGLVSSATLKSVPQPFNPKAEPTPAATQELVQLARAGGTVSYKVSADDSANSPAVWIEQDQFVISKLLFKSEAHVSAKDYQSFGSGLQFPKNREVTWGQFKAHLHTNSVSVLGKTPQNRALVAVGSLTKSEAGSAELPDDNVIRAFYSQFR